MEIIADLGVIKYAKTSKRTGLFLCSSCGSKSTHKLYDAKQHKTSRCRACTNIIKHTTALQDQHNLTKDVIPEGLSKTNTSGYHGVSWISSLERYRAAASLNHSSITIGLFDDPIYAAIAYDKHILKYNLTGKRNFPDHITQKDK